jgi:hypothetical protein
MSELVNWIGSRAPIEQYRSWNREERHMAATLHAMMLTDKAGLHRLLAEVCQLPCTRADADAAGIWFEFAFLRDWWWQLKTQKVAQALRQEALCKLLKIVAPVTSEISSFGVHNCAATLKKMEPRDFNRLFSTRPSNNEVESPARWSESVIAEQRAPLSFEMARRAVLLAWLFRIKPDIVVTIGQQQVIVIEAKWESRQSRYSCTPLALERQQIQLQVELFSDLLGFGPTQIHSILLAQHMRVRSRGMTPMTVTWAQSFQCFRSPTSSAAKSVLREDVL